jgi:hypothetical protein
MIKGWRGFLKGSPLNGHRLFIKQLSAMAVLCASMLVAGYVYAQDTVCAVVKIEIKQELTLERQAFDAEMKINNALDNLPLESVKVVVNFEDEAGNPVLASSDPNNTSAKFFIRVATKDKIDNVDGSGSVAPKTTAEIHWLIIPAPGAAENAPLGKVFMVGATLTYTVGGEEEAIEVEPDRIVVKPLPKLTLDYFLEREVFADDPFTPQIEPSVPFTLGVRIRNSGLAPAQAVKIDSAQPKIVENKQGLLIGFEIISSFVSDQPAAKTLLINFGDIPPNNSKVGRWQMITTLDGQFTEFKAEFTHADELGGALTSILQATNAHFLIKDVMADAAGHDGILDFLANDGDAIRLYESNNVDTVVTDQSGFTSLEVISESGLEQRYRLTTPPTAGFMYTRLPDLLSFEGRKVIKEVIRSDGKRVNFNNAWFSRSKNAGNNNSFEHFLNLFDNNTPGSYILVLANKQDVPVPPVIQFIPDRSVKEGRQISFIVEASDANNTIPQVFVSPLPPGAQFYLSDTSHNVATYIFDWTPAIGQKGRYELTYMATDGQFTSSRRALIDVLPDNDTDNDGMDDDWEREHFGNLDRNGTGDFDGDGISDLEEFLNGTDPAEGAGTGPTTPVIESPLFGAEVHTLQPTLTVRNSTVTPPKPLVYEFEIYADAALSLLVASATVNEQLGLTTSWQHPQNLDENEYYYWRARAYDGTLYSQWVNGEFLVNDFDEPPGPFAISSPMDGAEVDTLNPLLEVMNSVDPDPNDLVSYRFEVYTDSGLGNLVASVDGIATGETGSTGWVVDTPLTEDTLYYWRAIATDTDMLSTASPVASFFVSTFNAAPSAPSIHAPADGSEIKSAGVTLAVNNAFDPDDHGLQYYFELDTVNTFDGAGLRVSGAIPAGINVTSWTVSGLIEDARYYWRVRASDGMSESPWIQASFTVNAVNLPPPAPTVNNPGNGSWVATLTPALIANPVLDPDGDEVGYRFEIYLDAGLTSRVDEHLSDAVTWQLESPLTDNTWYYWRVRAEDENGEASAWSILSSFFVDDNGVNDTPVIELTEPAGDLFVVDNRVELRWHDEDPDSSATIALYYDNDDSGEDGVLIVANLDEDADGSGDSYVWDTTGLANGTYYIYAVISDGNTSAVHYAPGSATLLPAEIIVDNRDPTTVAVGQWTGSTEVSGFHGADYQFHVANGLPPGARVFDNGGPGFEAVGQWTPSTEVAGYFGSNYLFHVPNGLPVNGVIIDNRDSQFSASGDWASSTAVSGYYGSDYLHSAPAAGGLPQTVIIDNTDPRVFVIGHWPSVRHEGDHSGNAPGRARGFIDDFLSSLLRDFHGDKQSDKNKAKQNAAKDKDKNKNKDKDKDKGGKGSGHELSYQYHKAGNGKDSFTWNFSNVASARYEVYVRWEKHQQPASNALYTIRHDGGLTAVKVDQRKNGKNWKLLGTFNFTSGQPNALTLSDKANGYVVADAVKLVPVSVAADTAVWTFTAPASRQYLVYARWTQHANRASNARYTVAADGGSSDITVDQRLNGGQWNLLGTFSYTQGMQYQVRLTDQADGYVIADAIRFVPVDAGPNTASWSINVGETGQYLVYARWTAHANRATNAVYTVADDSGMEAVQVNQRQNGGQWNLLGAFDFSQGGNYRMRLTDEANGYVIADAVMVVPVDAGYNSFTWNVTVPASGQYEVYARWTAHPNRATDAKYMVRHDTGDTMLAVNQRQNGAQWNRLGVFTFTRGGQYGIILTDQANGYVIADAIRLVPLTRSKVKDGKNVGARWARFFVRAKSHLKSYLTF